MKFTKFILLVLFFSSSQEALCSENNRQNISREEDIGDNEHKDTIKCLAEFCLAAYVSNNRLTSKIRKSQLTNIEITAQLFLGLRLIYMSIFEKIEPIKKEAAFMFKGTCVGLIYSCIRNGAVKIN